MSFKKQLKRIVFASIILGIGLIGLIFGANWYVQKSTKTLIYTSVDQVPFNEVGLLLGTSKHLSNGNINLYYKNRIKAAYELFQSGKIKFILVSGDNGREEYDEPTSMKEDLVKLGVPADKIFLDYAGFRTLDSVVRCKEIFGRDQITVISQQFHNERAIFIANRKGMNAVGFNATDVNVRYGFKTQQREKLARVKMLLDLLIGKDPKFLGDRIEIK